MFSTKFVGSEFCYNGPVISPQARIIKVLFRLFSRDKVYQIENISQHRDAFDRHMIRLFPPTKKVMTRPDVIAGVPVHWLTPGAKTQRTIIYLHGGGFVFGSPRTHSQHMSRLSQLCSADVIAIDYALAPEHPFPAALDQIEAVWRSVAADRPDPHELVIMGDSAGGNLALATAVRLRDKGLPLPKCLVLLSPALDGTFSGHSYETKQRADPLLSMPKLRFFMRAYTAGHDSSNSSVSPLFAKLEGLPPLLIHVGSDELLLSDSERLYASAQACGIDAELYIGEGMWHGWHFFARYVPEAKAAMKQISKFVTSRV